MDKNSSHLSDAATVSFLLGEGQPVQAPVLRFSAHQVAFEVHAPTTVLRASEVLKELTLTVRGTVVYRGRSVIRSEISTTTGAVYDASLEEAGWSDVKVMLAEGGPVEIGKEFAAFMNRATQALRVRPEFKLAVADLQTMLTSLQHWMDRIEFCLPPTPASGRSQAEREALDALRGQVVPMLDQIFDRFESAAAALEPDAVPHHASYVQRQLHHLVLCAPFMYRTFAKPLGYAGDYEMVNMIMRDPAEGGSLFAKVLNMWFLAQPPAQAHRNRVEYLAGHIAAVTARAAAAGRQARIITLGCGPAWEVQRFLENNALADKTSFTLLDFNDETIEHTRNTLNQINRRQHRAAQVQLVRRSVNDVLKQSARKGGDEAGQFDFVYCAGLYDYLPDTVCRRLSTALYHWVAPGGLFVITNVDQSNPRRLTMDYVMDWHLIYRDGRGLCAVRPEQVPADDCRVVSDDSGVNIYLETMRPLR